VVVNLILTVVSSTVFIVLIMFWSISPGFTLSLQMLLLLVLDCTIFRKIHAISSGYKTRGIARGTTTLPRGLYPAQNLVNPVPSRFSVKKGPKLPSQMKPIIIIAL